MKHLDEAVAELDEMDSHLTGYKMQLGVSLKFIPLGNGKLINAVRRLYRKISRSLNLRIRVFRFKLPTRKHCLLIWSSYW